MVHIGACPACEKEIAGGAAPSPGDGARLRCPHCDQEFAPSEVTLREVPELILASTAADASGAVGSAVESQQTAEQPAEPEKQVSGTFSAEEKIPDTFLEQEEDQQQEFASPIDMPVVAPLSERQEYDGQINSEWRAARAAEPRSFLRHLVGIVGGGVVGLALGYFILLWIGGPQKDFLEIGHRLPRWMVPAAFHRAQPMRELSGDDAGRSLADLLQHLEDDPRVLPEPELEGLPPEPPPREHVAAAQPATAAVAVIDAPKLTTADLDAALKTASEVRLSLVARETSDATLRPLKESAYQAFTALAEAVTFAMHEPGREIEHAMLLSQAEQLLLDTLANERMIDRLGPLAAKWIETAEGQTTGVVAAGIVIGSHMGTREQRGILVELTGTSRTLPVVAPFAIDAPLGARVVVVGSLIDEPEERIRGYTGSAERVVWAGLVLQ